MCRFYGIPRSRYYDFLKRLEKPERDEALRKAIEECREKTIRHIATDACGKDLHTEKSIAIPR